MAQTSVRRDQENQAKGERFERAPMMDLIHELPYGPAACEPPQQRPDTWQHPIQRRSCPKILLAPEGASTHALQAKLKGSRQTAPVVAERPKPPDLAKPVDRRPAQWKAPVQARPRDTPQAPPSPRLSSPLLWEPDTWLDEGSEFPDRW